MAQNYISEGHVITIKAEKEYKSGEPYRINGFNGVALLTVKQGDLLSFQLEGVFELEMNKIFAGDLIYIFKDLHSLVHFDSVDVNQSFLFGRAVTSTDKHGKFHCRLLQS